MFRIPILFVIGADASQEAELPTGSGIKKDIALRLRINALYYSRKFDGDYVIYEALRHKVMYNPDTRGGIETYLAAAKQINQAMLISRSIDNFIDNHRGNDRIELCAKLAITQSILAAERNSKLYF